MFFVSCVFPQLAHLPPSTHVQFLFDVLFFSILFSCLLHENIFLLLQAANLVVSKNGSIVLTQNSL